MQALTTPDADIDKGLDIVSAALQTVLDKHGLKQGAA